MAKVRRISDGKRVTVVVDPEKHKKIDEILYNKYKLSFSEWVRQEMENFLNKEKEE